jgi:hypothetical protein
MNSRRRNGLLSDATGKYLALHDEDTLQGAFMRAYVAQLAESEPRRFVPEDALPQDVMSQLIREWSLPAMTTFWTVLGDEGAEAAREELAAGRHRDACGVLLERAVEFRPIVADVSGSSPRTLSAGWSSPHPSRSKRTKKQR